MMTKKDFVKVAGAINRSKDLRQAITELSNEFQEINPRFDRSRFIAACFKEASE